MFDYDSEQGLLKFIEREAYFVVLVDLLVFGEVSENFGEFFCVGDEGIDLED